MSTTKTNFEATCQLGQDSTLAVEFDAARADSQNAPTLQSIGSYDILKVLGQGAMGKVYLAQHQRLLRKVALKVLPKQFESASSKVERFNREMAAIGRLDHPNIVRATDAGEVDGWHFIAMEYVDGIDLQSMVGRLGKLDARTASEMVRQVARGLSHIHECGLVHRDIKPSNLMVSHDGTIRVLDLGIALLRDTSDAIGSPTMNGATLGTPDFIAPEQVLNTSRVDIRADIYSLGCTFYQLLTGKVPYHDPKYQSEMAKLFAHTADTPPSILDLAPETPPVLVQIVGRMMERYAADRYQTPNDLIRDLDQLSASCDLSGLPTLPTGCQVANSPTVETPNVGQQTYVSQQNTQATITDEQPLVADGKTTNLLLPVVLCCSLFLAAIATGGFFLWQQQIRRFPVGNQWLLVGNRRLSILLRNVS
ncbi:MAG: serine/threonine-protein kinase, partial [Planctomycetota bacterium]